MGRRSREHAFHHLPVDIGQPEVAAIVTIGELFVIEAEQVQDRRVQVVEVEISGHEETARTILRTSSSESGPPIP